MNSYNKKKALIYFVAIKFLITTNMIKLYKKLEYVITIVFKKLIKVIFITENVNIFNL